MDTWTAEELHAIMQAVCAKSGIDALFRETVLADPYAAIEGFAGRALPAGLRIDLVVIDPAAHVTLLIPPLQSDELTDQQLAQVSGGGSGDDAVLADAGLQAVLMQQQGLLQTTGTQGSTPSLVISQAGR